MSDNTEEEIIHAEPYKIGRKKDGTFEKGSVPNPHGRPKKGSALTDIMREFLDEPIENDEQRRTRGHAFVRAVHKKAMLGDQSCMRLVWEYMDGKPVQTIKQNLSVENPAMELLKKIYETEDETGTADTDTTGTAS